MAYTTDKVVAAAEEENQSDERTDQTAINELFHLTDSTSGFLPKPTDGLFLLLALFPSLAVFWSVPPWNPFLAMLGNETVIGKST